MFRRVRVQLVLMNTVVISVILVLICGILYVFTRERVLQETDMQLYMAARTVERSAEAPTNPFFLNKPRGLPANPRFGQLPTTFLVWSSQGKSIKQVPDGTFSTRELQDFATQLKATAPFTLTVENHAFRVLDVSVSNRSGGVFPAGSTVQVVRNMDDSLRQLSLLRWLIIAAIGAGVLLATVAGLFLAGRALVPINRSWERQQKFVSDASHELRTPLAVIQAQAELMLRHPTHTVEQEASNVGTIYEEARRMGKLVESLLILARADSNQSELTFQSVSLSGLLDSLEDIFTLLCEQSDLHLEMRVEAEIEVLGDPDRLRQLLLILFDNALKYTAAGGLIRVACVRRGNQVEIEVKDTGSGISPEDLPHIFERFYRGDKARSRSTGGAGLGLSIAEWIAQVHEGKITAQSTVGKGTTMRVLLPAKG